MDILRDMQSQACERLIIAYNRDTNLQMIIVLHDRTLGRALGGIRFRPYPAWEDALTDAMRLARGMTYKNAIINLLTRGRLSYGGGKAVIIGDPESIKTPELLLAAAEVIEELNGEYIGGEDMGMGVDDIEIMLAKTRYVTGTHETHSRGGRQGSGNPALVTALGGFAGIRACLTHVLGNDDLKNRTFALQGLGNAGLSLLEYLATRGTPSRIVATDSSEQKIAHAQSRYPRVRYLPPQDAENIYSEKCDVFVPCAIGGIINDETIPVLRCKIVAGLANNQLLEPRHGEELHDKGILYAPDYVINAGGAINVSTELQPGGYDHDQAREWTQAIGPFLLALLQEAGQKNLPPEYIADKRAEDLLESVRARHF